jgi:hypothetical protein
MYTEDKENAGNVLVFSPPRGFKNGDARKATAPEKAMESMICAKFQHPMQLDFGAVAVGSFNSIQFLLINPDGDNAVKITVAKASEAKGFEILLGPTGAKEIGIPAKGKITGVVTWAPTRNMGMREVVKLLMHADGSTSPLQLTISGKAGTGKVRT